MMQRLCTTPAAVAHLMAPMAMICQAAKDTSSQGSSPGGTKLTFSRWNNFSLSEFETFYEKYNEATKLPSNSAIPIMERAIQEVPLRIEEVHADTHDNVRKLLDNLIIGDNDPLRRDWSSWLESEKVLEKWWDFDFEWDDVVVLEEYITPDLISVLNEPKLISLLDQCITRFRTSLCLIYKGFLDTIPVQQIAPKGKYKNLTIAERLESLQAEMFLAVTPDDAIKFRNGLLKMFPRMSRKVKTISPRTKQKTKRALQQWITSGEDFNCWKTANLRQFGLEKKAVEDFMVDIIKRLRRKGKGASSRRSSIATQY